MLHRALPSSQPRLLHGLDQRKRPQQQQVLLSEGMITHGAFMLSCLSGFDPCVLHCIYAENFCQVQLY
jgi:hypothetical protein